MLFLQYNISRDPTIDDEPEALWNCVYNHNSRSRFSGLNEDGIGFINTSDVQDSYTKCGSLNFLGNRVGVVVLALDTRNIETAELSWKVKLIRQGAGLPLPREYRLHIQYRVNPGETWKDFNFSNTYSSLGKTAGHSNTYTIQLPEECINKPNIQVRWKYYQHEGNDGGSRPFISLDNIRVRAGRVSENRPAIISSKNAIDILGALKGSFSRIDSVEIDGYGLSGKELFIKIPEHFQLSLDKVNWKVDSLPLEHNNGEIRSVWLYVRYYNEAAGLVNSQIKIQTIDEIFKIITIRGETYPKLYFNELMAINTKTIQEPQRKEYFDWIEIFNPNSENVDYTGWYISDDMSNPTKYRFFISNNRRFIIPSNGFEIIWASGLTPPSRFPLHLPFSLSSEGEQLILVGSDRKTIIDSLSFGTQLTDISYGRNFDGSDQWVQFNTPTPKKSNNSSTPIQGVVKAPTISPASGWISSDTRIQISSEDPDALVVYTLDGSYPDINNLNGKSFIYKNKYVIYPRFDSIPGEFYLSDLYKSHIYQGPIDISDCFNPNNQYLDIATNFNYLEKTPYPAGPVKKICTIRAVAYKEGFLPSAVSSQTYLPESINFNDSLVVVNINIDPENYYDYYKGIAVAGVDFDKWREENPNGSVAAWKTPANFRRSGRQWEIPSEASFFLNKSLLLQENCGIRIHGRASRTSILKSYRLYFRSEYGKEPVIFNNFLEPPPYNNFHRFILKSRTDLRDIVAQQLSQGLNLYPQAMTNASIFVNGQYHGIGYLLERQDEYYFKTRHQLEEGTLDIITNTVAHEGSSQAYYKLLAFFRENNFTNQTMYDSARALIDINNFIDYYSAEIFLHNVDWPGNNIKLWRYNQPNNNPRKPYGWDGKWRWILFDLDGTLNHDGFRNNRIVEDNIYRALNFNCPGQWCTIIFSKLTENNQFKNQFTARLCDLMNTFFKTERINFFIERNRNMIDGELKDHFVREGDINSIRWPYRYDTYVINPMRDFARLRHTEVRKHLRKNFGYQGEANITLHVDDYQKGYIKINTIEINELTPGVDSQPYPWRGTYVTPLEVSLIPIPREGFKFDYWEIGDTTNYNDTLFFTFRNTTYAKAYFSPDTGYKYFPEPYNLVSCPYYFDNWPANSAVGSYPPNMVFYATRFPDSGPNGELEGILDSIAYDHDTQTRINGLSASGLSFTNANGANNYYLPSRLGAAVIALNTEKIKAATVTWTGGTVKPNSKEYAIRLQYRIGEKGPFKDMTDEKGKVIEYRRNEISGHKEVIGPHSLPSELMGKKCIQLAWRYYYTGVQNNRNSEARDQLSIDEIIIGQKEIAGIEPTGPYSANLIGADGGLNYQWFECRDGIPFAIENATEKTYSIRKAGEYALSIDYGECRDTSSCEYFFVKEYISLLPGITAMVYPNPATSILNVQFSGKVNDIEIKILDIDGRVISTQFANKDTLHLTFDINKFPSGVYILRASTKEGKTGNTKFIKL